MRSQGERTRARLLEAGYAYESYSTPEEIEARHRAAGRDPKLGYDGFDRDLTEDQTAELVAKGRMPVLRFRMPDRPIVFHDLSLERLTGVRVRICHATRLKRSARSGTDSTTAP